MNIANGAGCGDRAAALYQINALNKRSPALQIATRTGDKRPIKHDADDTATHTRIERAMARARAKARDGRAVELKAASVRFAVEAALRLPQTNVHFVRFAIGT